MATSLMTSAEAGKIDKDTPDAQVVALGTKVYTLSWGSMIAIPVVIDGDYHTTAKTVTIPCDFELVDVVVQARATTTSASAIVRKTTTAITNEIIMAVDTTITRAGTIDDAQSTILTTDNINVITHAAGDRGLVTLIGYRS